MNCHRVHKSWETTSFCGWNTGAGELLERIALEEQAMLVMLVEGMLPRGDLRPRTQQHDYGSQSELHD